MKTRVIFDKEAGLLFRNGKFVKMLGAGKHAEIFGKTVEVHDKRAEIIPRASTLEVLLENESFAKAVTVCEVRDNEVALHFVNGRFAGMLSAGKHAFFAQPDVHTFTLCDISNPELSGEIPSYIAEEGCKSGYCVKVAVAEYQKARLYYDKKFVRLLDAGTYYFWRNSVFVDVGYVDTRLTQTEISGQEVMTRDRVTLRVNLTCNYRITDYVKCLTEVDDYAEQLHVAAQLALREYVGAYRLDELLEAKEEVSKAVFEKLKTKAADLYVEVRDAAVKDIILPGEIREIMNTVLVAEKRAQANVITRREEVASTRSLLNTAKLMEENKTLYKLKEMEYIERICENVGSIELNAGGDMLSQLLGVLGKRAE